MGIRCKGDGCGWKFAGKRFMPRQPKGLTILFFLSPLDLNGGIETFGNLKFELKKKT